ncbi:branched-chain-amino-acid aminotransferase, cytosolic [Pimephales promelas]|nr:branched-chain-amino-acid aminotransferase, cytosolic [Pimephales promelas]
MSEWELENNVADNASSFKAADTVTQLAKTHKPKPDINGLMFGTVFTDHMLTIEWSLEDGWQKPHIRPFGNLSIHPSCSALHYAIQLFEGMKAYRGPDDKVRLFRPMMNMKRMQKSAHRACLPSFDGAELLECIRKLVEVDQDWVPHSDSASLYIRPTFLGTEPTLGVKKPSSALLFVILSPVGSYFSTGAKPVSLWADSKYIRAWRGGTGDCKMGGNYGASIYAQYEAVDYGCQQVLWLYGDNHQITEVGTMNLFLYWINEKGGDDSLKSNICEKSLIDCLCIFALTGDIEYVEVKVYGAQCKFAGPSKGYKSIMMYILIFWLAADH